MKTKKYKGKSLNQTKNIIIQQETGLLKRTDSKQSGTVEYFFQNVKLILEFKNNVITGFKAELS